MAAAFHIEPLNTADTGRCPCCGHVSRKVWGMVHRDQKTHAAYFVHWTVGHVFDHGAHIDLILGQWGDGTSAKDRYAVSLEYRVIDNGPQLMVIDSKHRDVARSELVGQSLNRSDVIGRPLAAGVFAVCDAVLMQDARLKALWDMPAGG